MGEQAEVWSLLAGVLHVGNVRFTGDDAASILDPEVAAMTCRLYAYPPYHPTSPALPPHLTHLPPSLPSRITLRPTLAGSCSRKSPGG